MADIQFRNDMTVKLADNPYGSKGLGSKYQSQRGPLLATTTKILMKMFNLTHKCTGYVQKKRKERACTHWECWFKSWYATHIWMFSGKGEDCRYKTAYIYPDSCYKEN